MSQPTTLGEWRKLAKFRQYMLDKAETKISALEEELAALKETSSVSSTVFVYQKDGVDHVAAGQHEPKKRRGRPPVDVCKRGHDTTAPDARYASGNCRKCTNKKTIEENAA